MTTKLDYVSGKTIIPEGAFGISPSGLHRFFSEPWEWCSEMVDGNAPAFQGNTATVLGTIIHFIAEEFTKTQKVDKAEIYKYLFKEYLPQYEALPPFTADEYVDDNDYWDYLECILLEEAEKVTEVDEILMQYKIMGNVLIDHLRATGLPDLTEQMIKREVIPGYYASGSADAVKYTSVPYTENMSGSISRKVDVKNEKVASATLIDYKTTSATTAPTKIPWNYKIQLLTYAWIYRGLGINIDRVQIAWVTRSITGRVSKTTGKPLKDYPSEVTVVSELITDEDYVYIENMLKLVAESVEASKKYPELRHIIWKDYRMKVAE